MNILNFNSSWKKKQQKIVFQTGQTDLQAIFVKITYVSSLFPVLSLKL